MDERSLRFEVATRETLERLMTEPFPGRVRPEGTRGEFFRDVYWDTPDGALERRGAVARLRMQGTEKTLTVEAPGGGPDGGCRSAHITVSEGEPHDLFAGLSEPARLLRGLVDPARLRPWLELETARTTRTALLNGGEGEGGRVAVICDATLVRSGDETAEMYQMEVRYPAAREEAIARSLRETAEEFGLRAVRADPIERAGERLGRLELDRLEEAVRSARRVAILAMDGGRVALRRDGELVAVPAGPGKGEEACRRATRACFGHGAGRVRLLGTQPGHARGPSTEVWVVEGVRPDADAEAQADVVWMTLEEAIDAVGSPALRDAATLVALAVVAREGLAEGDVAADVAVVSRFPALPARGDVPLSEEVAAEAIQQEGDELPPGTLLNMELSVLAFNRRVLALAEDPETPLFERVRFLSIFYANLDEFFRVRVAGFKRQVAVGSAKRTIDGVSPQEQLDAIGARARTLMGSAYRLLFGSLLPALARHGIRVLRPSELDDGETEFVRGYYRDRVHAVLTPLAAGPGHPFPHIRNLRPALGALIREPAGGPERFVVIELPGSLPRFVPLPDGRTFVPVEDVIRGGLGSLYPGMQVEGAWTFRVTRSAELSLDREHVTDLLQAVEEEVRRRPFRPVVRLEVEGAMPPEVRALLIRELQFEDAQHAASLGEADVYPLEWLVDLRGLREIAGLEMPGVEGLHYPAFEPRDPLDATRPVMDVLREREVMVHFPHDSFEATVERFVTEAADDPDVVAIKLALYRTNRSSRIVEALRRASARGKQVVALVELTARFDEQRNIEWARYLRAAGIHVIHGLPGLKIHAKVALVVRREAEGLRRYLYVGTGNLNATTSAAYTDLGLLSADEALGEDVNDLFNLLTGYAPVEGYRRMLVAPQNMRARLVEMIDREAGHAREGRGGHIRAKFNGLADREIISALYRASQAGVRIELVVRGLCALRPGVEGLSENVWIVSILGRFLEHMRIFRFANAGEPEHYIGSADWRTRNLSKRVEVVTPVADPDHRARLDEILEGDLADPRAWELGSDGTYYRRPQRAPHAAGRIAGEGGRRAFAPEPPQS